MYKGFILKFGDLVKTLSLEKCLLCSHVFI